ncbi:MAG: FIST signal transduction protein [Niabella sp.]
MKAATFIIENNDWQKHPMSTLDDDATAQLVLCFGSKNELQKNTVFSMLSQKFPIAEIALCSSSGEIYQENVYDCSLVVTALQFDKTNINTCSVNIKDFDSTYAASIALAQKLSKEDLAYVLVFSDGTLVNGSELVKGLTTQIDHNILVTGGLAGDGEQFESTVVGINNVPEQGQIVAIGFYGSNLKITHGSQGGWDIFGLEKRVTRSNGNILVDLENQNALDIYKKYLGEESKNLPGSALRFPLSVIAPNAKEPVVRTILSVNEKEKTMSFAGDIPLGSTVRLMKTTIERVTSAAAEAAAYTCPNNTKPQFSLLISCVGRKIVLGSRTKEEIAAVSNTFNNEVLLAGFYSYGEISPFNNGGTCQLHNQTMTITSFYER